MCSAALRRILDPAGITRGRVSAGTILNPIALAGKSARDTVRTFGAIGREAGIDLGGGTYDPEAKAEKTRERLRKQNPATLLAAKNAPARTTLLG